jgi:hydrogenase maturation protease
MSSSRALLIGFGNPGRGDDGLGPALAEAVEGLSLPGVAVESDYQLAPEHAAAMLGCDLVIFADAALSGPEPYSFERLEPSQGVTFSSHSLGPREILGLAESISGGPVEGYLLAIRGYEFEPFTESLTARARRNLERALEHVVPILSGDTEARTNCEGGR